jgi:hypothetical protein
MRKRQFAAFFLFVAVCGAALFYWLNIESPEESRAEAPTQNEHPIVAKKNSDTVTNNSKSKQFHTFPKEFDVPEIPDYLKEISELSSKALLSEAEKVELLRQIVSDENIESSLKIVEAKGEKSYSESKEKARMFAISHLARVGVNVESEAKSKMIEQLEALLLTNNLDKGQIPEAALRKSLAGDKVEIYQIIRSLEPERARRIVKESGGTDLEGILHYAEKKAIGEETLASHTSASSPAKE